MKRNQIRFIVILGTFAIIGIIIVQTYWLQNAWSIKEKQFNQTVQIALRQVAERMSAYNQTVLPNVNPVNQLSANYFVVNLNSVIDANILEYYLQTEFDKLSITADYEYAIYDCHDDKMVYGDYISAKGDNKPIKLTTNLPKYSDYVYYFGINFPSKKNYLGADMTLWIIFSVILLVSVIFFGYAMFVILQQKRLSELQKDFINNMTHEFKTPISSINISADVISSPEILNQPQRLKNYSAIIKQENSRLNELVEKVLQIARIEKGGFELKKELLNLNDLIAEVVENHHKQNGNSENLSIQTDFDHRINGLKADPLHLTNIFYNLFDNATKYSLEKPQILVKTTLNNRSINIEVRDNGPGIGQEYQKKVFQKFFRVPTGNVHNVKGFGLGLYYVKKVCEAHGWNIRLESEVGKGSIFIIEIK
ncbi:MAG: HAMP domain-containing histidine kinase [Bacteroidales bacterium]|nr:HAMP domain-containing histidine kinase [Bacteroidales bacterium]